MAKHKHDDYSCPRCGYQTPRKSCMRNHLYKSKKPCPCTIRDLDITEEIKEHIMVNRVYHLPAKQDCTHINKVVNNFNIQNNMISRIDTIDKLSYLTAYRQVDMIGLEDKIEKVYGFTKKKLETNGFKYGFNMKMDDLFDIVNEISSLSHTCKDMEEFNVFYDKECDKLNVYEEDRWEEMVFNKGVKVVLEKIQGCFWYAYECYLLRQIYLGGKGGFHTARCREHLDQYFKFIGCFDMYPYLWQRPNKEILYNEGDPRHGGAQVGAHMYEEYTLSDEYGARYIKVRDGTKRSEVVEIRKNVVDIIKNNSIKNTKELNKRVFELFQMDEKFKNSVIQRLEGSAVMISI